jgi:hypothetical protein
MAVLNRISREELEMIPEEWLLRLDRSIQQNGECVEYGELLNIFSLSQLYPVWSCENFLGHPIYMFGLGVLLLLFAF